MGKSLGTFTTLKDAFKKWSPEVIRFFILQSHYRSTLDFSNDAVEGAAKGLEKLSNAHQTLLNRIRNSGPDGEAAAIDLGSHSRAFVAAMDDDFNTPQAIAVLFDLVRELNQLLSSEKRYAVSSLREIEHFFGRFAGDILGLLTGNEKEGSRAGRDLEPDLISLIISLRQDIRAQKLWPLSDKIRDGLQRLGIVLEDRKEETTWKRTS